MPFSLTKFPQASYPENPNAAEQAISPSGLDESGLAIAQVGF
jgi:hypothetical protein